MESNNEINSSVSIIAHDAGGAELLSSYVIHQKEMQFFFALSGPAIKIFNRKLGLIKNNTIEEAVSKSNIIFCGTGWSRFELKGLIAASKLNKKTIAFLDHWVDYRERFIWNDDTFLPDEIWVVDTYAQKHASSIFPEIRIRLIQNYYFEDIKKEYKKVAVNKKQQQKGVSVLFVSDNFDGVIEKDFIKKNYLLFTDIEIFRYLIRNIDTLHSKIKKIIIRPHPSELNTATKYEPVMSECKIPYKIGGKVSLLEEIANNDIVVGGESMALVVAMICGKEVYSCMPPEGKYTLPFDDIKRI
jgi:hypothetical protein